MSFNQLEVECDNALIVESILNVGLRSHMLPELCLIKQRLCRDWKVGI